MSIDLIPPGWVTTTIADDIDLISGQHIQASECSPDVDGTPYLTGPTDFPNGKIIVSKYTKMPKVMCNEGDILLTVKGSGTGKLTRADRQYCISRQLMALRPRSWDRDFIFQVLLASQARFENEASGLIPGLSREQILSTPLAVPSSSEQRKIAAILSSVDDTIEKTQAVIDQLEAIKRGLIGELLTRGIGNPRSQSHKELGALVPAHWQVLSLGQVLAEIDAGWSPQCESRTATNGEWGVLKVSAVSSGTYIQEEHKALPESMEARPDLEVRQGDVLITRANGVLDLVGRSAFVHKTRTQLMLSDKTLRLRPLHEQLLPYFLHLILGFEPIRAQILEGTTGSHMRNISQSAIRKVIAPIPPLNEQKTITETVMSIENRIAAERDFLTAQKELKNGLLDALLTGRIRPSVPQEEAA
jgi:type I restriction enzyme S subunit